VTFSAIYTYKIKQGGVKVIYRRFASFQFDLRTIAKVTSLATETTFDPLKMKSLGWFFSQCKLLVAFLISFDTA
jgi:hypothetical protein